VRSVCRRLHGHLREACGALDVFNVVDLWGSGGNAVSGVTIKQFGRMREFDSCMYSKPVRTRVCTMCHRCSSGSTFCTATITSELAVRPNTRLPVRSPMSLAEVAP
jgi:hypothetical protein